MTEPPVVSTSRRFVRSTLASYWSLAARLLVTTAARMALGRLILDQDYGTYDLALRIVTVAGAVRDLGLAYQLMRDPRRPYGTVMAFSVLSGIGVTVLLVLGAPLAGGLAPALPDVLRLMAVWVLLDGLAAAPRTFFERELRIGRLMAPEISRGLVIAAVSVGLAWRGYGVWSLVWGDILGAALYAALLWWRAWNEMPRQVDWKILPDLLRRGRTLFAIWVLFYVVTYVDSFIVGLFTDVATVGQYGRAYYLAFLARQIVFPRALLPALVEYREDPPRFAEAFRLGSIFLLFCEVAAGLFLFWNAAIVVELFLGPGWGPAVPILRILCLVPFLDVFSELGGEVLKVRHEDRVWLLIMVLNLTSLVGFGVVLTRRWGAEGMAWANFLLAGNLVMVWRMKRIFGAEFAHLLRDMALVYAVPLALFGAAAWASPANATRLVASVAAGLASAAILFLRFRPLFRRFLAERAQSPAAS
jgi:O-antigen/teichoic acid export membrane protein